MLAQRALAHYDAFRLRESYALFRRMFEALPRGVSATHAAHLGPFVQVSMALGRRDELGFYAGIVEELHRREVTPHSRYVLAYLYQIADEPRWEASRAQADAALRDLAHADVELDCRLRALLAYYHERAQGDYGACRDLIFGVDEHPLSDRARVLLRIWRAVIHSNLGETVEAHAELLPLRVEPPAIHWYWFYSARVVLANLQLREGDRAGARATIKSLETYFAGPYFKLIQLQMRVLRRLLRGEGGVARLAKTRDEKGRGLPSEALTGYAKRIAAGEPDEWVRRGLVGRRSTVRNLT